MIDNFIKIGFNVKEINYKEAKMRTASKYCLASNLLGSFIFFSNVVFAQLPPIPPIPYPAAYRWDVSRSVSDPLGGNLLGENVVLPPEDQGPILGVKTDCSYHAVSSVIESTLLIQDLAGINLGKVDSALYPEETGSYIDIYPFYMDEGPMMEYCTGEYYVPMSYYERCPRLPFYLLPHKNSTAMITQYMSRCRNENPPYYTITQDMKYKIMFTGPITLKINTDHSCDDSQTRSWDKWILYSTDGVFVSVRCNGLSDMTTHFLTIIGWNDNIKYYGFNGDKDGPKYGAWLVKDSSDTAYNVCKMYSQQDANYCYPGTFWFAYFENQYLEYVDNIEKKLEMSYSSLAPSPFVRGNIRYVTVNGSGSQNGLNWANAYDASQLQTAIDDIASLYSSTGTKGQVWVEKGQYYLPNELNVYSGVHLMGGYYGDETEEAILYPYLFDCMSKYCKRFIIINGSTLDANYEGSNQHRVIHAYNGSIIDGFTITNGISSTNGGGILAEHSGDYTPPEEGSDEGADVVIVKNCHLVNNNATSEGGGLYALSAPTWILNTEFTNNSARNGGGVAISYPLAYTARISECLFGGNTATFSGGGIYINNSSSMITKSEIRDNYAQNGGGVSINYWENLPSFETETLMQNNIIWGNRSSQYGSAIHLNNAGLKIYNTTLYNNTSDDYYQIKSAIYANTNYLDQNIMIVNSILWGNPSGQYQIGWNTSVPYASYENKVVVYYSDVQIQSSQEIALDLLSNSPMIKMNISEDPLFENASNGDFNLAISPTISPCIDVGQSWADDTQMGNPVRCYIPRYHDKTNGIREWIANYQTNVDMGALEAKDKNVFISVIKGLYLGAAELLGSKTQVNTITDEDGNNLQPLGNDDGNDHVWTFRNNNKVEITLYVKVCPQSGNAVLAFYSAIGEMISYTNTGGQGECENLSAKVGAGRYIMIDVDTYGNNSSSLGEYNIEIKWEPGCGCHKEWITADQNLGFSKYTLNNKATAPWQFGVPTSGPNGCYGGTGSCWATNLSGNYNNSANECVETTTVDLSECGAGTTAELSFMQWYDFENNYDGANVEAWNGTQWNIIDPQGGYPDTNIQAPGTSVHGKRGYSSKGTESTWYKQFFYVQGYSNPDFKVRFCFGSDQAYKYAGWYIDDVSIKLYDGNCGGGCYDTQFETDFNADNGGFSVDPNLHLNSSWAWGTPTGSPATGADGKVWATNPTGNYNTPEDSCVDSPVINLSQCLPWQDVKLQLRQWYRFWHNLMGDTWDGSQVQAWDGTAWKMVEPEGGYPDIIYAPNRSLNNKPGFTDMGEREVWHEATFDLAGYTNYDFKLRFCMASSYAPHPGWYIDNVKVEGPPAPNPSCATGAIVYGSDFEGNDGGFTAGAWHTGGNDTWAYGTATSGPGSCHGGSGKCWATNLSGNYQTCEDSYIEKAVDLGACTGTTDTVYLVYWHWFEFETETDSWGTVTNYDGYTIAWTSDGTTWSQPETSSFVSGAFNTNAISADHSSCSPSPWVNGRRGYQNKSTGWQKVVVPIPADKLTSGFKLRLAAGSDGGVNKPGAYIDNVCVAVGDYSACN